ncbi:MAG: 7TM diverse intracellular signaling domain-containing protein [Microscillaceae bacterium]|nr:7TM diverse intracellular signaling domain-containing protein [Microscillaceae bacterium]
MRIVLIFFLISFPTFTWKLKAQSGALAQKYVTQVDSDSFHQKYTLDNYYLRFYEDKGNSLKIEDIAKPEFEPKFKPFIQLSSSGQKSSHPFQAFTTYWVEVNFRSNIDQDTEWLLFLGFVSHAEVYTYYPNGRFEKVKAGFFTPNIELKPREGQEAKAIILLKPQSKTTVYIKFRNEIKYPPELNLSLQSYESWQVLMNQTNLVQGVFHGLLWLMLLYNFFLFFSIGDKTYAHFALYVLFMSLFFFNEYEYLEEYFLPYQPQLSFYLYNLIYVALVYFIRFNRRMLNLPANIPRLDKFFVRPWLFLSITFALASVPLHIFLFDWYIDIRNGFHLFYLVSLIIFTLVVLFRRDGLAQLIVLGNFFILSGGLLIVLGNFGVVPFSLYYLLGGVAAQLFVFMMAMSYRYRKSLIERQETQEKLIIQLQENKELQTKVNRELEDKVRERTIEIEQKKEEIQTQHEALQTKSEELERAYKNITDSARYAQRLQGAILGEEREVLSFFQDGFILFLPKDLVSGDFYWASKIGHTNVLVAADCTGHGIPGALMTMLGNSILNAVVNEDHITSPEHILHTLDERLIRTVQKQNRDEQIKDGMDMVVITFDEISYTLKFAGAKNPLYYVRNHEIHKVDGSTFPIGIYNIRKEKKFELQEIQAQIGDTFYLSSDGFQDQFGGPHDSKYMKKKFREFLLDIHHLPMPEQKHKLEEEFLNWKGSNSQTDDILIIGFRV